MPTVAEPYVNLLDPGWYVDPWDAYRWLRDRSPVHWDPVQEIWGISRYADVVHVEKRTDLYTSVPGSRPHTDQSADRSMINTDDPQHQEQRKLVVRRFTPRAVRSHEERVRDLVDPLLDQATAGGDRSFEVIEQVASRLPAMVIAELLGYEPDQWPVIRRVSENTMYNAGQTPPEGGPFASRPQSQAALDEWGALTMELIATRRAAPADDLVSVWCHSETDGVPWDDGKILEEVILVVDGGAETTRTVIGSITRELALRPDVQNRPREHSICSPSAVEEFIRWVSPILNMRRTATRSHQLYGQTIEAGHELLLLYPSANRDERVYDRPEEFDVTRERNHHVAFGFGTHVCLGASLARLELRVVFEQMLARLPAWRLVPGTEPRIVPATFTRAFDQVHVEF